MSRRLAPIPTLAALLLLPLAAESQEVPSPYRYMEKGQELELLVGYLATDPGRYGFGPQDQQLVGARYGVVVSNAFALEGSVGTGFGPRDVVDPRREEGDRVVEEAEVRLVFLEARLQFALTGRRTWNRIQPFTYLGGGISFDTLGDQDEDALLEERDRYEYGTRFTGAFGGGFRLALTDRWMARVDAGLHLYKLGYPSGWRDEDRGLEGVPEDEWMSGQSITLGLAWRF